MGVNYIPERVSEIIEANIIAAHGYQVILNIDSELGDKEAFNCGLLTREDLLMLIKYQENLLTTDINEVRKWINGEESDFNPTENIIPILESGLKISEKLPVSVITHYLENRVSVSKDNIRAIANLYQVVLEVERDGGLLQHLFDFYISLGLTVYIGQFGLPGSDDKLLEMGEDLTQTTCAAPYATDAIAWQIAGRKIWNWAEKKLGIRNDTIIAKELLEENDIKGLLPKITAIPCQRIAVVGHSFTMDAHWSSPSSFTQIAAAIFHMVNPSVEIRHFSAGGLKAERAYKEMLEPALSFRPDKVIFVYGVRKDCVEDLESVKKLAEETKRVGAVPYFFDNLQDPFGIINPHQTQESARNAGMTIIEVDKIISEAANRDKFLCLDGIHMTEAYHRLMTKELLKFLAGAFC